MSGVYRNLESLEGTASGQDNLVLVRKSRKIVITNDDPAKELQFKFNESEEFATLMPTETISMDFTTDLIIVLGSEVPYRIWVYG